MKREEKQKDKRQKRGEKRKDRKKEREIGRYREGKKKKNPEGEINIIIKNGRPSAGID